MTWFPFLRPSGAASNTRDRSVFALRESEKYPYLSDRTRKVYPATTHLAHWRRTGSSHQVYDTLTRSRAICLVLMEICMPLVLVAACGNGNGGRLLYGLCNGAEVTRLGCVDGAGGH